MRMCKIASCCKLAHHPCCKDCKDKRCDARCLNSPEHCGCWEDSAPPRNRVQSRKSKINRQELLRLHEQGLLLREIAQRLGCGTTIVSTTLRKMGVKRYG